VGILIATFAAVEQIASDHERKASFSSGDTGVDWAVRFPSKIEFMPYTA
jgi:hypothetical protein